MKTRHKNRALFRDTHDSDVMGGLSTVERKSLEGAFYWPKGQGGGAYDKYV